MLTPKFLSSISGTVLAGMLSLQSLSAAQQIPPVPDPLGLGERLALIDHLQEQYQLEVPAGTTLAKLKILYAQQWRKAQPKLTPEEAAQADRRRRLLAKLKEQGAKDIEQLSYQELLAFKQRWDAGDRRRPHVTKPDQGQRAVDQGDTAKETMVQAGDAGVETAPPLAAKEPVAETDLHPVRGKLNEVSVWQRRCGVEVSALNGASYTVYLAHVSSLNLVSHATAIKRAVPVGKHVVIYFTTLEMASTSRYRDGIILTGDQSSATSVQEVLLRAGLVWYGKRANKAWHERFLVAQAEAQKAKRGIWAGDTAAFARFVIK